MQRKTWSVLGLVLAAGVALAGCDIRTGDGFELGFARGTAEDTWTRSYPLAPGGRIELINVNGRIDAEPASGPTLELVGRRKARGSSDEAAKENLGRIEIREEAGAERVRIEVRVPRFSGLSGHEVKWTLKVPKGVHVDLRNVNGSVNVEGLDGEVRARTTNGGVHGSGIAATSVHATTVNGGVEMELVTPLPADGRVEIESVNGGVEFALPAESKATITARAVNGGVRVSDLDVRRTDEAEGSASRRRLQGTLNGGGAAVSVETVNGGVALSRSSAVKPTT